MPPILCTLCFYWALRTLLLQSWKRNIPKSFWILIWCSQNLQRGFSFYRLKYKWIIHGYNQGKSLPWRKVVFVTYFSKNYELFMIKDHFSRCLVTAIAFLTHAHSVPPTGLQGSTKSTATRTFENIKKAIIIISSPSLHDYEVKMPNFTFYGGLKQAKTKFSFSFWNWIRFLTIKLQESSPTFDKESELE